MAVVNPAEDLVEQELMLNRFNRLIGELLRGTISRNGFQPWEIDLLIDIQACQIPARRRGEVLRQYQRAVIRRMETAPGPPLSLSKYLENRKAAAAEKPSVG